MKLYTYTLSIRADGARLPNLDEMSSRGPLCVPWHSRFEKKASTFDLPTEVRDSYGIDETECT